MFLPYILVHDSPIWLSGCISNSHIGKSLTDGIGGLYPSFVEDVGVDVLGNSRVVVTQMIADHLHRYTHVDEKRSIGVTKVMDGRHTTTARELYLLENGSLLLDTPGIRAIGTYGIDGSSETVFSHITALADSCRFSDCTHTREPGCAVLKALEEGAIDADSYEHFLTLQGEAMSKEELITKKREKERNIAQIKYHMRREK